MKYKLFFLFIWSLIAFSIYAQTETKSLRIVDSLTPQEKKSRNPIILKSELDSLIKLHEMSLIKTQQEEPAKEEKNNNDIWLLMSLGVIFLLAVLLAWLFFQQQKKFGFISNELNRHVQFLKLRSNKSLNDEEENKDKKLLTEMQTKFHDLNTKLEKLKAENESLLAVLKEYSRTQNEYESLIKTVFKTFKVKKYPGISEEKTDVETMLDLFETERLFTSHVYENYLKPIIAIADANKNNPAQISGEQQDKMLELLISLSLLYIEYLYLRVNDLSVGGNIVQRINDIKNGLELNSTSLKKLNTQNGSRALVLHLALEKINLRHLSYPVFEETNLNNR